MQKATNKAPLSLSLSLDSFRFKLPSLSSIRVGAALTSSPSPPPSSSSSPPLTTTMTPTINNDGVTKSIQKSEGTYPLHLSPRLLNALSRPSRTYVCHIFAGKPDPKDAKRQGYFPTLLTPLFLPALSSSSSSSLQYRNHLPPTPLSFSPSQP